MFKIMFYVSLALAIFFLIVSVVLFVRNNVAKLIGDVTGWNTKRAKKEFFKRNVEEHSKIEQDQNKALRAYKSDRKKKIPVFSELEVPLSEEEVTTLLEEEATTLLSEEETTLLAEEETTLLVEEETTLLTGMGATVHGVQEKHAPNNKDEMLENIFEVEQSMMVTHTDESIDE